MPTISCPSCGSADDLERVSDAAQPVIACGACGHRWRRGAARTCRLCGSQDLEPVPTATLEEAGRGNQRTPSGIRDVYRCWSCGARDATSSTPQPAEDDWLERRRRVVRRRAAAGPDIGAPTSADTVESAFGAFQAGAVVGGRWRLDRLIHTGTTGTVWAATAVDVPHRVVFKLLHPRLRDRQAHAASARTVAAVRHPSLVRVLDVRSRRADVLIVAEAVEGSPLAAGRGLTDAGLRRVGAAAANALAAMHDAGLSHLDVRPAAILVSDDADGHLVDLGAGRVRTRAADDPRGDDRMTWLAPERIVARRHEPAADVYSLGLTLWAAAGGELVRLGSTAAAQARQRLAGDLPALQGDHDDALVTAIRAATRRHPEERPTAAELCELLSQPSGR